MNRDIDEIVNEPQRTLHGNNGWWEHDVPSNEQCVKETPAANKRARARRLSLRYGWLFEIVREVRYVMTSWFTTDVVLGLFRASYAIIMAALLIVIIYSIYYAKQSTERTLPTVDDIMKQTSQPREGPSQPQDGTR